jgi:hypothetical protein
VFEKFFTLALTPNPSPKLGRGVGGEGGFSRYMRNKIDLENTLLNK